MPHPAAFRLLPFLFAAALLLAVTPGCSRQQPDASSADTSAADARRAQREALFGPEALAPEVQWRESGLGYRILTPGDGPRPGIGATVRLTYVGRLKDGTVFDRSTRPTDLALNRLVAGLSTGIQLLNSGGKAAIFIPPALGYGSAKVMGIPPDSGLIFDVELLAVNP